MWGWPWQILGAIRTVATVREGSFIQKTAKIVNKISRSCDFGHHYSAMITNAEK